ncbi:MAG: ATPase [Euryarchaeota archaeon]|nr:ATPase [Euryarchaeota archaeon]
MTCIANARPTLSIEDTTMTTPTFSPSQAEALRRLRAVRDDMATNLVGRDREVNGLCISLLADCHTLLLGVPGTAKSLMATEFARAIGLDVESSEYFETLLGSYSNPDEVFGPYNPAKLLTGVYERNVDGYLPTAHFGFLDEIFNATAEMLVTLNTILNERRMKQGTQRLNVPLKMVVGAANVYPQGDLALAALYDRFLLRYWTPYVETRNENMALLRIARDGGVKFTERLMDGDCDLIQDACKMVHVPDNVLTALVDVRSKLGDEGVVYSDRRHMAQMRLVQAVAALDGRAVTTVKDLFILADSVWDHHEQRATVWKTIATIVDSALLEARVLLDAVLVQRNKLDMFGKDEVDDVRRPKRKARRAFNIKVKQAIREIEANPSLDLDDPSAKQVIDKLNAQRKEVGKAMNDIDLRI